MSDSDRKRTMASRKIRWKESLDKKHAEIDADNVLRCRGDSDEDGGRGREGGVNDY